MNSSKPCKDCVAEGQTRRRAASYPGPRCHTHWRAVVKARKSSAHARTIEKFYGITNEQYMAIYAAQGGVCAICRIAKGHVRRLAVDHDHETGEVRGLLCSVCNEVIMGRFSIEALERAIEYRKNPPARAVLSGKT